MRRVDIATAKRSVQKAAEHIAAGIAGSESLAWRRVRRRLLAHHSPKLARLSSGWPDE